ncbi:MAG: DNA adenine methylase [Gemmatimonadaceae bacterium]|nr:DNA adenine methylase [Gemmatimonadaceae bacterium]
MLKYLGSKRRLVPRIVALIDAMPRVRSVIDLFSGSARVAHALKGAGYQLFTNDHNQYAHTVALGVVQADAEVHAARVERELRALASAAPVDGWFTQRYARDARFFHPENAARIEGVREAIARAGYGPELEAALLTALIQAADRVDSTTGVHMAYLKAWAPRALLPLELREPRLLPRAAAGKARALGLDALAAAQRLSADVAYLDPPYNQHSYLGNYHLWETLVRWDAPEVYGVAQKRVDVKARTSRFNSRPKFAEALTEVVRTVDARTLVLSFSDEGFVDRAWITALLEERGPVKCITVAHPRYVGARIGIHDPRGRRVGRVSHVTNREYLFVVG